MLRTRLLPRDEWWRLEGTEAAALAGAPPGFPAQVLVVEDEDQIVATWALITRHEVEGLWVRPEYRRKVAAQRHLFSEMMALARSRGILVLRTAAQTPDVAKMIEHLGGCEYDQSLRHFAFPVVGERPCQQ